MLILAAVYVYMVFRVIRCVFGVLVSKILGGFMKWAFRNKTAEERLKMAIFKLLALSYMLTTLYISFFYSNNITKFYVV